MDINVVIIAAITASLGLVLGYLLAFLRSNKQIHSLHNLNSGLQAQLETERRLLQEKAKSYESNKAQFIETFSALSSQALSKNNEEFLRLAQEKLKQFQVQAEGSLNQKEKAIETLLNPIKEALEKTERQVRLMENERKEAYGVLHKHLESMAETQRHLHGETSKLVNALKRPEVRGQWGEMTLKRLAELSGMVEHCDFLEQTTVHTENGRLRPDMIVRLPGGRDIVVDIKTPLDAYIKAIEATNDAERQQELIRHARQVKERVKELASKAYWQQFKDAPDFVVLFIPGDQFLSAALDIDRTLLEEAMQNRVILSTPTSFVALLRAVAYGWRQESLAENAEQIRQLGESVYERMTVFAEHLVKVGKSLEQGVDHYNKAVGSFNSRILPSTRKFVEMGVHAKKDMPELNPVEKAASIPDTLSD